MMETDIRVSDAGYILPDSNIRVLSYDDIRISEYELYLRCLRSMRAMTGHSGKKDCYSGVWNRIVFSCCVSAPL